MLGYEGLRPQELLALMDDDVLIDVGKLLIARKNVDGKLFPYLKGGRKRRNRRHRRVDLLDRSRRTSASKRMRTGRRRQLLIARARRRAWRKHDWDNWRERVWQPLAVDVGLGRSIERKGKPPLYQGAVPYDLRASFVSLLVWEGRTMLEVAAQAGHGVDACETYYARVFEGYDPAKRTSAEAAIRAARQGEGPRHGPHPKRARGPECLRPREWPGHYVKADGGTRTPDPIITSASHVSPSQAKRAFIGLS
jgi:hypothetical protein